MTRHDTSNFQLWPPELNIFPNSFVIMASINVDVVKVSILKLFDTDTGVVPTHHQFVFMRFQFIQNHPELARIMAWQTLSEMPASTSSDHGLLAMQKVLDRLKKAQEDQCLSQEIAPEMIAVVVFISTIGWFQNDYRWLFSKQLNMSETELDQKYLDNLSRILLGGVLA